MKRRDFIINSTLALSMLLSGCATREIKEEYINSENSVTKKVFKNLSIPMLGFGCMRLPLKGSKIDIAELEKMVDYAIQHGINYFDTAYMYMDGKSEETVGKVLKNYKRNDIIIADKAPLMFMNNEDDMLKIFDEQLSKRVNTEYFDFYMAHNINKDTIDKYKNFKVYDKLAKLKQQGVIKNLGFSFHGSVEMLEEIVSKYKWDFCQLQINYLDWNKNGVNSKQQYEIVQKAKIPTIVMEPLRGGNLCKLPQNAVDKLKQVMPNETPTSYALRWVASKKGILTTLSGMSNLQQLKENVATFENFKPLTAKEENLYEELVTEINKKSNIACTGCKYCMEICPKKIAVSDIFSLYNQYKSDKNAWLFTTYYKDIDENKRADKCIDCGLCKTNCPQALDIPKLLAKIDKEVKSIKL